MGDVYISYARENIELARPLVQLVREENLSCWWDQDLLDEDFEKEITIQLEAAKAVVVIWTLDSVKSEPVLDEACWARRKKKLINVHSPEIVEPQDGIPHRLAERINSIKYTETDKIIRAIKRRISSPELAPTDTEIASIQSEASIFEALIRYPKYAGPITNHAKELGFLGIQTGSLGDRKARWLKPKDTLQDLPYLPRLVVVPDGKFQMGALTNEEGARKDEFPRHEVTIRRPLAVGIYPVTVGEWEEARKRGFDAPAQNATEKNLPATHINWYSAKAYTAWLRKQTGFQYRLLSEAEWEYCCRAGSEDLFSVKSADFNGSYSKAGKFTKKSLGSVGEDPPNSFGLRDFHGKVWEWVEDDYHFSYDGAPLDGSAWYDQESNHKVLRGGCFASGLRHIRAARRARCSVTPKQPSKIGFRAARQI